MNLEEQTVNGIGEIHLQDALNASLLKIVVKCTSETVLPADNDLIIYVDKMTSSLSTSSRKQFVFSLEDKLRFYNNISDEFILTFNVVNNDIKMKGIVNQKIEYENSNYSFLENSINYEVEGFPITLFEGENYIYTNYENASISLIYPKNNDENKLFLNSAIYYNHNEKQDGEFSLDDIYFKDCFTKTEDKMNLEVNNLKVDCITSNNNKFSLDKNGNLTVNSITSSNYEEILNTATVCNLIYPVGSLYLSVNAVNPSTLFGGTWQSFGSGRCLVGVDTTQTEFSSAEKIGGSKTHTLTISQIPSHNHNMKRAVSSVSPGSSNPPNTGWANGSQFDWDIATESTGGSQAHNNLQPYITVYMWKRVS